MKGRHQRRAFAACSHIAAAEVGDGGYAGDFSDSICITDLQGKAVLLAWPMTYGLTVVADGGWLQIVLGDEGIDGNANKLTKLGIGLAEMVYVVIVGLTESQKLLS